MPRSRVGRIIVGILLIICGLLGFLPVLGFWMVPLGLLVLSQDLPFVRRQRRRLTVWWARRRRAREGVGDALPCPERGISQYGEVNGRQNEEQIAA